MSVYVDELRIWGERPVQTCHLTADAVDELQAFAEHIGLPRRAWHSGSKIPHYDVNAQWRARALEAGALFVSAREQARRRLAARRRGDD